MMGVFRTPLLFILVEDDMDTKRQKQELNETKELCKETFGSYAYVYEDEEWVWDKGNIRKIMECAGKDSNLVALDVACGTGIVTLELAKKAKRAIGIDLTGEMLEIARKKAQEKGVKNVEFRSGDAENIEFPDNYFDLITCRYAFHHFPKALLEFYRVLKGDGRVVIVDPVVPEDLEIDTFLNEISKIIDPSHGRFYNKTEMEEMAEQAGFSISIEESTPIHCTVDNTKPLKTVVKDAARKAREYFNVRVTDDKLMIDYPIAIFVLEKIEV